ncbi:MULTISPECIES: hypothetical protein [Subtercola]|uniref:Uncharacterized protein n=1 Tax=Subtercola vilae TaxID=2056433 RepID=A0A4V4RED0_9MICO|nr:MULTISPECIES: hypothetical protein [Subtercola]MEA9986137.1 hypothetical protein [Subtercola sp. RTI3]TIH33574.1 hypothetical protein D4765_14735 [Subtercola vilae]
MDDLASLSATLTAAVRTVTGVTAVYASAPAVVSAASVAASVAATVAATAAASVVGAVAGSVGGRVAGSVSRSAAVLDASAIDVSAITAEAVSARDSVRVSDGPGGLVVSVTIGVDEADSATEACRRVYDVIADLLAAAGEPVESIAVTVGRIG